MGYLIPIESFQSGRGLPSESVLSGEGETGLFRARAVTPLRWSEPALLLLGGPVVGFFAIATGRTVGGWLPVTVPEGTWMLRLRG